MNKYLGKIILVTKLTFSELDLMPLNLVHHFCFPILFLFFSPLHLRLEGKKTRTLVLNIKNAGLA